MELHFILRKLRYKQVKQLTLNCRSTPAAMDRAEAWPWEATPRPRSGVATEMPRGRQRRRSSRGELPRTRSGAVAKRSNPPPRSSCCGGRRAERSCSTFKVRRGGCEKIPLLRGREQRLHFAGAAVKRYPTSAVRETQVRQEVLQEGIRGQTG